jgi:hypothetical protein
MIRFRARISSTAKATLASAETPVFAVERLRQLLAVSVAAHLVKPLAA